MLEIYDLSGNISESGYNYTLKSKENLVGNYDTNAREEVRRVYEILNN